MTLTGILTTAVILSSGMTVPNSVLTCWIDIEGAYTPSIKQIYICEWAEDFTVYHEYGHYYDYNLLSKQDRATYDRLYWRHKRIWIEAFYRWHSYYDPREDFADNYALMMLKQNSNPFVMKRIRLIKSILWNN